MDPSEHCCVICRQVFPSEHELHDHCAKLHTSKVQSKFHCQTCNRSFRDSYNLKRHVSFVHSEKEKEDNKISKSTKCPICCESFQKKDIINHFSTIHKIEIEEEDFSFSSMESFQNWKIQIEKDTKSRYVKVRNVYKYKDGSTLDTFYCHRDGFAKSSRSKNIRRMKAFGSNKINGHCPSKIIVKCSSDDSVQVKFIKTHVGHTGELCRISLDKKEKEALAEKLSMNVPFDEILDDIRDSIKDSDVQRVHLLNKQDLRNIARDYKVKPSTTHTHDGTNDAALRVEGIFVEGSNFIRLYKPKGVIPNEFSRFKAKDFILLVMNDTQKAMLEKYGNNVVCIDIIHGLFLHDIDMYTLVVLGDTDQAFPCAFWFSNRFDVITMELILQSIREIIKTTIKPEILMTCDTIGEAWNRTMETPNTHVYCSWSVDFDWRNNLKKIKNREKETVVYKKLRKLLENEDIDSFDKELNRITCNLYYDPDTSEFGQYFEGYRATPAKWAICYRQQIDINFSDLEKVHRLLRYIYLKRQKTEGLDDTICNLMCSIRGKFLEDSIMNSDDKLTEIKDSHRTAINMTQANLAKVDDTTWDVSDSNDEEMFRVEQVKPECPNCPVMCKSCSVCIHLYVCVCYDSSVMWNMCQHVHLVCIVANHEQSTSCIPLESTDKPHKTSEDDLPSDYDSAGITFSSNDSDNDSLALIHTINPPIKQDTSLVELKKKEILSKVTLLLNSSTSLEQLELIDKQLSSCDEVMKIINPVKFE